MNLIFFKMAETPNNRDAVFSSLSDAIERAKTANLQEDEILKCLLLFQEQAKLNAVTPRVQNSPKIFNWLLGHILWVLYRLFPCALCIASLLYPTYYWYIGSPCLIPQYLPVAEFAMPVINCSFCRGLNQVSVVNSSDITVDDFMTQYAYSSQPLLIKGAASSWPAIEKFTYSYFKELYVKRPEAVVEDKENGQFFAYSSGIRNLEEFLNLSTDDVSKKWYIGWSSNDEVIGKELRKHFKEPSFLPRAYSMSSVAWIFMGSPGPGASLHIDFVGNPSWQAQLSGTKTWSLVPPPECEHCCSSLNITVHRGDIFVLDTNVWFHSTFIHPGNMSITIGTEYL